MLEIDHISLQASHRRLLAKNEELHRSLRIVHEDLADIMMLLPRLLEFQLRPFGGYLTGNGKADSAKKWQWAADVGASIRGRGNMSAHSFEARTLAYALATNKNDPNTPILDAIFKSLFGKAAQDYWDSGRNQRVYPGRRGVQPPMVAAQAASPPGSRKRRRDEDDVETAGKRPRSRLFQGVKDAVRNQLHRRR
ncbi:hypothetical protein FN846DRAFT_913643 [Sphaerosporella brunnea]|uniref:Uncharacterized protein n=1 Tax=Sphaerosporella brunnea TaxID=1250544 RepID=A0A5J5EF83_9PEZI|nr:hypothetical protein FN846DRAFT_913643 [Sphaerosporella brunnea]